MLTRVSKDTAGGSVARTVVFPLAPVFHYVGSRLVLVEIP